MLNPISTLNAGSGIDSATVVTELVAAERSARATPISSRVATLDARISALAQVKSSLQGIATSLDTRLKTGALGLVPASSDTGRVTIARLGDGPAAPIRSSLVVNRLATAQTLTAAPLASADAPVGEGRLTLRFGTRTELAGGGFSFAASGTSTDVTIAADNNSLTGLRDAINAAGSGVSATIVTSAAGASLALRGADGAAQAFTIEATPAAGDTTPGGGLARFGYSAATPTLSLAGTAGDAALTLDGIAVTRASNIIDDLVPGTRLSLQRADPLAPVTLTAARDPAALESALGDLATTLGQMRGLMTDLRRTAQGDTPAGALLGDATARSVDQRLAGLISASIPQANGLRLSDLGLSVARDGSISFDSTRLAGMTPTGLANAEALLKTMAAPALSGQPNRLKSIAELVTPTSAGLTSQRGRLTTDLATVETRLTAYRTKLVRQFAAMDAAVAISKQVGTQLTQQIDAWVAGLSR
ncbi:hypothetical protein IP88_01890 [alpha proteobacterium AAP81b]|nr:hypothetical protein IP88_01890 [alpha proteobacterium AAP81b]